ncbi:1-acyl-sn-glycerol-3-phosphate acyltransferase [Sphingobacterium suaedae]|uniref:1-acyl-sn-glycerol-3-phosphate acyltransferase n=1 Tax=Sphingobacterium suaedae TaxID=1686402 RepID=A0ABW5KBI5_9SPHI
MFYAVLRQFVRLGLRWYAPGLKAEYLAQAAYTAPSLIVSNHPNSLFDALVIGAYSPVEVYYLTRGDIFNHPVLNVILRGLFMLPVYKRGEDEEYAVKNDFTFDECIRKLEAGKHILLFPEGKSRNLHALQPLMNGGLTSLLERCFRANIPVQIQPYMLKYNSFQHVPKALKIRALDPVDSTNYIAGNEIQTADILGEIRQALLDAQTKTALLLEQPTLINRQRWRIPAMMGYYTQFWFYKLWRDYVQEKTQGTIFFDSLLFGVLLISYPIFVLLCSMIIGKLAGFWIGLLVFLFLPATSYAMAIYQSIYVDTEEGPGKDNSFSSKK